MIRYIGRDGNGIARVWGEGPTADIAESRCLEAVMDYVRRRPDTGPLSKWKVDADGAA